jgi:hypothetical protein
MLRHGDPAVIADQLRIKMLIGARILVDRGDMYAPLWAKAL